MLHAVQDIANLTHMPPRHLLILLQGILDLSLGGVRVYINAATEEAWMDLSPGFDQNAAVRMTFLVEHFGFEVMQEVGAVEDLPDGVTRNYIAQTWFPDETEELSAAS